MPINHGVVEQATRRYLENPTSETHAALVSACGSISGTLPNRAAVKNPLESAAARISAKHQAEIARMRKAIGPVPDFRGTLGSF